MDISRLVLSPIQIPIDFFRIVCPTRRLQVGDQKDFVQEEELILQCWTTILATYVVVDVSKCPDTLTWEVSAVLERPPV